MMTPLLLSALLILSPGQTKEKPKETPVEGPPAFEVQTTDQSTFRVSILDSTFEITTAYGVLVIPVKDVRKVEMGLRLTSDETSQLTKAIGQLTGPDRKARVAGREAVIALGDKALPSIRRAKKATTDPEALAGVTDLETKLASAIRERSGIEKPDRDTIVTDSSQFVGTIGATEIKVLTGPFGEQKLKLSDLVLARSLATGSTEEEGELIALPPGGNLIQYQGQFGKVFRITLTGGNNATIYGTGTYTLDSNLNAAAVHTGVLRQGETGTIRVKIVASPQQFISTTQNGLQSSAYGQYPPGAFEVLGKALGGANGGNGAQPLPAVRRAVILGNMQPMQGIIR